MATKDKNVALAKRAKIDKAQQLMLLAVCGASIVLGITVVGIVYFAKVIKFNARLIDEKDTVILGYKEIQNNLESIASTVSALTDNDKLESVARKRADECYSKADAAEGGSTIYSLEDIEVARTCSSLRLIPDAMPSTENADAASTSLYQLLLWSNNNSGVQVESLGPNDNYSDMTITDSDGMESTAKTIGLALTLNDTADAVKGALSSIENSIRNYDIKSASISWNHAEDGDGGGEYIELSAAYVTYYSTATGLQRSKKTLCADKESEACVKAGGDGTIKEVANYEED